ncbi:MAG: hypothetical protein K6E15_09665 [Prevotella sp.]|nr:hypothetical protein [Prevotella sp.]
MTAIKGDRSECCIGKGYEEDGTCTIGTITIGGTVYPVGYFGDESFTYQP